MNKAVILCVDDEKIILMSLKEQLKNHFQDYQIEAIDSPEIALDIVRESIEKGVDLPVIISDWLMPGMKGDELLAEVHEILPETKKILLTGQANAEAVGNAINHADLYRYISKPWDEEDLVMTLKQAIYSYFQDKELKEKNEKLKKLNHELERKIEVFNKFVPAQFLKLMDVDKDRDHIELGQCQECKLSVLFADIRSFTHLSESMSPEETFKFINKFLGDISPYIVKHKGFIDKFIGDAIMALFPDADNAVRAAVEMTHHVFTHKNVSYSIGVSVHTGITMIGTVGQTDRLQTTVLGDTVNITARIQELTRTYNVPCIITSETIQSLRNPSEFRLNKIDTVKIRGREKLAEIYEVIDDRFK